MLRIIIRIDYSFLNGLFASLPAPLKHYFLGKLLIYLSVFFRTITFLTKVRGEEIYFLINHVKNETINDCKNETMRKAKIVLK